MFARISQFLKCKPIRIRCSSWLFYKHGFVIRVGFYVFKVVLKRFKKFFTAYFWTVIPTSALLFLELLPLPQPGELNQTTSSIDSALLAPLCDVRHPLKMKYITYCIIVGRTASHSHS